VFRGSHDYLAFLEMLLYAKERYQVELFAFCLLPDHFHLLVRPVSGSNLSHCMQWLQTSYARRFNDYHGTEGPLWQGRYKSFLVQENEHLLTVMSYIEGHPLRIGLADTAEDYVWSSHRENYWGNLRQKLDPLPVPLTDDWAASVDALLCERTLGRLKMSTQRQIPYGSPDWQRRVCREYGLEDSVRPRGRPRKEERQGTVVSGLLLCLSYLLPGHF
jgi:putative transposase